MRTALFSLVCCLVLVSCNNNIAGSSVEIPKAIYFGRPPVVINEIYSANADLKDEFGSDPGWVEFYNPADTAVNLNGYWLTNSVNRRLWEFGDVVVEPRGYVVVFLSGRNRPDLEPPRDSISLLDNAVGVWGWADNMEVVTPPNRPGNSIAYITSRPSENGAIGGTITTRDNSKSNPGSGALGWTNAEIVMRLVGWESGDVLDISGSNQVLFRGSVTKNSDLVIRLSQAGTPWHLGWRAVVRGTGAENDLYVIELPSGTSGFPNLREITGIYFSNLPNVYTTTNFTFNSIIARRRASNVHAAFSLSNSGGVLFLMDSEWNIRDSVAYPPATLGLSYARNADNGSWALSKPPTPYAANSNEAYAGRLPPPAASAGIPASGYYEGALTFTLPHVNNSISVCCDTTGRFPAANSELRSGATLTLTKTTVMRCAQFMDGAHPSAAVMRTYIIGRERPSMPVVSIAVDPYDMFDQTEGLYSTGPNASPNRPHYGANYWRDIELPIQIEFFEGGAKHAWSYPAGLKIRGSYSRTHPKKSVGIYFREEHGQKNLNYPLFPEHPHLTRFKRLLLRNNGNNYGHDYFLDMMLSSLTEGLGIDYQKGRSVIVYYNGEYYGIHNLRERSNARYFETNYGIDRDRIDMAKADGSVSSGSNTDYQDIYNWIRGVTVDDEVLKLLGERIDIDNFTNYFQSQIYFANRDWPWNNLKRWRVNSPPTKWKWFMYDVDQGFGFNPGDIKMLDLATDPNGLGRQHSQYSTLMLHKLLQNESYKNAFINRFSLLLATYFTPARIEARMNTLMAQIQSEIPLDQERWGHSAGFMNEQFVRIRAFGRNRASQMQQEIEEFFGLSEAVNLTVEAEGNGNVLVDNLQVMNKNATLKAYPSVPVTLKAVTNPGTTFTGWSDGNTDAERVVTVNGTTTLRASFGAPAL